MPRLSPFIGLAFDDAVAGPLDRVTAPPYDVISDHHRLGYLEASPFSVVHLDLAEGTDDPADPGSRYARAAHLLEVWEAHGALRRAEEPSCYVYEMSGSLAGVDRTVHGLICAMELEEWGGTVLPHEEVFEGPVQDRLALLRATRTHLSPVYGTVDDPHDRLEATVREAATNKTPFEATDEQGVRHRMWSLPIEAADLAYLREQRLLMADGHHRYTTALRYRAERRRVDGPGPWDGVMTFVVDSTAEQLPVLPFHRLQLAGDPPPLVGDRMPGLAETLDSIHDDDRTVGTITRDAPGEVVYRIRGLEGEPPTVRLLHDEMLGPLASAGALRYTPDAVEADGALRRGDAVAAYLLPPTTPDRIRAAVERGERLPQKSTYFWPKPRTGMVMMPLDPAPGSVVSPKDRAS